jgi:hypothetical protein
VRVDIAKGESDSMTVLGPSADLSLPSLAEFFYDGEEPPKLPNLPKRSSSDENVWAVHAKMRDF